MSLRTLGPSPPACPRVDTINNAQAHHRTVTKVLSVSARGRPTAMEVDEEEGGMGLSYCICLKCGCMFLPHEEPHPWWPDVERLSQGFPRPLPSPAPLSVVELGGGGRG